MAGDVAFARLPQPAWPLVAVFARVPPVGGQGACRVGGRIEAGRLVAVVDDHQEPAVEARAGGADPVRRGEIDLGEPAWLQARADRGQVCLLSLIHISEP